MYFDERDEADYRIYAGALEAPRGDGYIAAVVVKRVRGPHAHGPGPCAREAFRDDALACGHRWRSPHEALGYAVSKAREVIRREGHRLAC